MSGFGESIYYDAEIEATRVNIRNLMESTGWNLEEAMRKLQIPEEEESLYTEPVISNDNDDADMKDAGDHQKDNSPNIFGMLDCLFSWDSETKNERIRILEDEYRIPMDDTMIGAMNDICKYGKEIRDAGVFQSTLLDIRNLMESTGWSAKEVMKKFKISDKEQRRYEESLKNNDEE